MSIVSLVWSTILIWLHLRQSCHHAVKKIRMHQSGYIVYQRCLEIHISIAYFTRLTDWSIVTSQQKVCSWLEKARSLQSTKWRSVRQSHGHQQVVAFLADTKRREVCTWQVHTKKWHNRDTCQNTITRDTNNEASTGGELYGRLRWRSRYDAVPGILNMCVEGGGGGGGAVQ